MIIDNQDDLYDYEDEAENGDTLPEGLAGFDMDDNDGESEEHDTDDYTIDNTTLVTQYDNDDDEVETDEDGNPIEDEDEESNENEPISESELINELLLTKGIENATIKYENEDGEIEEVDFYSLPKDEQLAILNSSDKDINYGLEENEIEAVNFMRQNGVTFEEAIDYYKRQAVQEYVDSQNIAGIEIDQYSDEELYALDLKAKYEDLTEEDIEIEINKQLEHPELFKKKVDTLRTEYREIEIQQLDEARLSQQREQEQQFADLQNNLVSVAETIQDIGGLDLDINDKNEVLNYILSKDVNGVSPFIKSLDSPEKLFEIAWYATKGKEAFEIVHDYYKKEIDKVRKTSYDKGRQEASKEAPSKTNTRKSFVRNTATKVASTQPNIKHIDDLEID